MQAEKDSFARSEVVAVAGVWQRRSHPQRDCFLRKSENRGIEATPAAVSPIPRGIDPIKALRYKERSGTVVECPGLRDFPMDDLVTMKCDVLVPAALENVITLNNAEAIKARIVAESRQWGRPPPHADEILARRGVLVLPDILANAGGVTVSYFEWVQNQEGLLWDSDEVNLRLQKIMVRGFQEMVENHAQTSRSAARLER